MSNVDIQLPDALKSFMDEESVRRGYHSPSEFMQALLEAERFRSYGKELEAQLLEAVNGPFTDWTEHDLADIERAGSHLIERRRKKP